MSRPVRPRLGRTQLRRTSSSEPQSQEVSSSQTAPAEASSVIIPPTLTAPAEASLVATPPAPKAPTEASPVATPLKREAVVVEGLQMSPATEAELPMAAIADQPTGSIPPTPVIAHPELSVPNVPVVDDEAPAAATTSTTGGLPVWALETLPLFAPRPMPEMKKEAGQVTPLEVMLRDLRVRKLKHFNLLRTSSRSALESIWLNRLISLLTTLSIFIGIAGVIVTLVLVQGMGAYFTDILAGVGSSSIVIDAGTYNNGWDVTSQPVRTLALQDVQELAAVQHVKSISPIINLERQVSYEGQSGWQENVQGVSPSLQDMQGWQLDSGLWFTNLDDAGVKQVAVLGSGAAEKFVEETGIDPLGENIAIGSTSFRVVGILAPQGGYRLDDVVFVPTNTALLRLSSVKGIDRIEIKLDNTTDTYLTMQKMVNILRKNHHLMAGGPADFQINASDELIQLTEQQLQAMNILLVGTAIILLVAGGIGIINIMLASVTRRTREIGVRIAVGARRSDIRNQFLIEALLLSLAGGGMGTLGGLGIGYELMKIINAPFIVTSVTFVMPFVIALFIGIVFGLYPAMRAARLEPVVALQGSWA